MIVSYLSLFLISLIGGGATLLFKTNLPKRKIALLLSFSGAYLIGICFLHLIPDLFDGENLNYGLWVLIGFFLQLVLDYFSGGIEHGHVHLKTSQIGKFPFLIFISLGIHAMIESIPLGNTGSVAHSYLYGLILHKIPEKWDILKTT